MSTLPVSCRPLDPRHLDEFLAFADSEAFADNPAWEGCYCVFSYVSPGARQPFDPRAAAENRALLTRLVQTRAGRWVLAYWGPQVVGWVHADLLSRLPRYHDWGALEPGETGVVTCFVVHPLLRRRGIARQLLAAAVEDLRERGAARVEAWVLTHPEATSADSFAYDQRAYRGPLPLYLDQGFTVVEQNAESTRVRLAFTSMPRGGEAEGP